MAMGLVRSVRRGRSSRRAPMAEINVTPFVDVMLVLLIIFMVTAPLLASGVPVDLPESRANPLDQTPDQVTIAIDREGFVYIDDVLVETGGLPLALESISGPEGSQQPLARVTSGKWRRRKGEKRGMMTASFPEVRASRLKLVITDYRNPPLNITAVRFVAPVRQMVIPSETDSTQPLRLYLGNPDAEAPNYDFAGNLPPRLDPPPTRGEFGQRQKNPAYTPLPPPLSERLPWLIYVVLGAIILVLAVLILSVGRAAIAAHDQQRATAAESA